MRTNSGQGMSAFLSLRWKRESEVVIPKNFHSLYNQLIQI